MGSSRRKIIETADRAGLLRQCRNLKMARSAHAYVRGNTVKFYEWLETTDAAKLPQGPPIWICGDCHLGNLGPIADKEGLIVSLATAARGSDLPGVTGLLLDGC
jgi:uncharacterized protein (DUF2252 family)